MLQCLDYGFSDQLLGKVEVAEKADQRRREPARLLAKNSFKNSVRLVLSAHAR